MSSTPVSVTSPLLAATPPPEDLDFKERLSRWATSSVRCPSFTGESKDLSEWFHTIEVACDDNDVDMRNWTEAAITFIDGDLQHVMEERRKKYLEQSPETTYWSWDDFKDDISKVVAEGEKIKAEAKATPLGAARDALEQLRREHPYVAASAGVGLAVISGTVVVVPALGALAVKAIVLTAGWVALSATATVVRVVAASGVVSEKFPELKAKASNFSMPDLKAQVSALSMEDLKSKASNLSIPDLKSKVPSIPELKAKVPSIPDLKARASALSESMPDLKAKASALSESMPDFKARASALSESMPDFKARASALSESMPDFKARASALSESMPDLKSKVPEFSMPDSVKARASALSESMPDFKARASALSESMPDLKARASALSESMPDLKARASALSESMPDLKARASALSESMPDFKARASALSESMPDLKSKASDLAQNKVLQDLLAHLRTALQDINSKKDAAEVSTEPSVPRAPRTALGERLLAASHAPIVLPVPVAVN